MAFLGVELILFVSTAVTAMMILVLSSSINMNLLSANSSLVSILLYLPHETCHVDDSVDVKIFHHRDVW